MPHVAFYGFGCVLLPRLSLSANLGELRLCFLVLIRTGLGTMAVLVAFVVAGSELWNYRCVGLGTWCICLTFYGRSMMIF